VHTKNENNVTKIITYCEKRRHIIDSF